MSRKFRMMVDTTVPLTTRETFLVEVPDDVVADDSHRLKWFFHNLLEQIQANQRVRRALSLTAAEVIESSDEAELGVELCWEEIPEVTA